MNTPKIIKSPEQSMGKLARACDRVEISHRAGAIFDHLFGGDEELHLINFLEGMSCQWRERKHED